MTTKRLGIKILKITGISLAILMLLLVGFHFWFKAHALHLLEDMVSSKSKGKVKLKIEKLRFNYFTRKIDLEKAIFYNTDTVGGSTAYRFSVEKMQLQVKAFLPLVLKKEVLIDSLTLLHPTIEVTRLRAIEKDTTIKKDVSIPEELGKVYSSIQDALKVLHVKRFQIDDGIFTLINKIDPSQLPLTVSNIHFHIDNLQVDTARLTGNENLLFSENVVLRSTNQNIVFPDGRHSLSFSQFRINLKNRVVEFDSCTIAATRGDSASASFKVFFDALLLTNIDFDTLYKTEVIKADSVYCINPKFSLEVDISKKKGIKKPPPKLENIIQQLTGNLQLGFVVVSNADFNIKTVKDGVPSSFTFSNNNFEMQGLSVDQDAPKAIIVRSFAMAIRNYENFIKDSSYSVKFDSVLFKDDRITLSNFLFNKLKNGKILNTFSVPQFNLVGLSWDDLVFDNKLRADQAIMFNPYISYTFTPGSDKKRGKQNIFQSLGVVNEYMDLQQLDIINGDIDLKLKNNLRVKLNDATLSVQSQSLLESKKMAGIKNSLTQLKFEEGTIHAGNMDIELHDIVYQGTSGQFGASSINVKNKDNDLLIDLHDVTVKKLLVDEASGNVDAEGIRWIKADVKINSLVGKKGKPRSSIKLNDVQGSNTSISGLFGGKAVSTILSNVYFTRLENKPGGTLQLDGLDITGKQLQVKGSTIDLTVDEYDITDNNKSTFRRVAYKANNGNLDAGIFIPALTVTPHIQPLLNGDIALDAIQMTKPVINLSITEKNTVSEKKNGGLPKMDISELHMVQPKINFTQVSNKGTLSLNWQGDKNTSNFLHANNLHTNSGTTSVGSIKFYLTDLIFSNPVGRSINTGDGKVSAQINNIKVEQEENLPLQWAANVSTFDVLDFRFDSLGKSKANLLLNSGSLKNLNISSTNILDLQHLVGTNSAFQVSRLTGLYSTTATNFKWSNASFNRSNNIFTLDSFSLIPALSKDSFLTTQKFQTDYITIQSGAIRLGPVDLETFVKNKSLYVKRAAIDKLIFTDYKDKQLPMNPGIIKPLAVKMLKKVPYKIAVDTVLVTDANVIYTEVSEKTKLAGTIPLTRMNVKLTAVKNFNIKPTDSLGIVATGYLMDTAWVRLRVKESYTDTLGSFLMTMVVKPFDLRILNPVLIPLASAKVESGFLDTISMRAIGREYLSWGEMQMFYHDLKIRILKNGDEKKKGILNGLINFLANSFVIKNKNTSRTGNIFFIRQRDKSAINYLIKIAMSGMASSVGAKNNKKMLRRYKNELKERNLPPIDFE